MEIHFAPLQGYADYVYLQAFCDIYGAPHACYSPFARIEKGKPRHQDIARLERWDGLVPQVIFANAAEFATLTDAIKGLGFKRIDLNLGCPFPMQTSRGRGAALVANPEVMAEVGALIAADRDVEYSVKMRLGMEQPGEWEAILPILNDLPLAHVTLHPRLAKQMYDGELHMDQFEKFASLSANPVIYNGDLRTVDDITAVARQFPHIKGVMIGRGLLARPSLIQEWQSGEEWTPERRLQHIKMLHDRVMQEYCDTLCGDAQILQKIKPFWDYLEPEIGRKAAKNLRKAGNVKNYKAHLPF